MVKAKPIYIGCSYRQAKLGVEPLKRLRESLSKIYCAKNPFIWLAGDFNVPDVDWSIPSRKVSSECIYSEEITSTVLSLS